MFAFPSASELQGFVGDSIGQISLDPFQVQFAFRSARRLVAALRVEHVEPDGRAWAYDCVASEGPPLLLHRLLGRPVVAVEREDLRLTLALDDGSSLRVFSELGPYESGAIWMAERDRIVF